MCCIGIYAEWAMGSKQEGFLGKNNDLVAMKIKSFTVVYFEPLIPVLPYEKPVCLAKKSTLYR